LGTFLSLCSGSIVQALIWYFISNELMRQSLGNDSRALSYFWLTSACVQRPASPHSDPQPTATPLRYNMGSTGVQPPQSSELPILSPIVPLPLPCFCLRWTPSLFGYMRKTHFWGWRCEEALLQLSVSSSGGGNQPTGSLLRQRVSVSSPSRPSNSYTSRPTWHATRSEVRFWRWA
jgi:hypothetical protein